MGGCEIRLRRYRDFADKNTPPKEDENIYLLDDQLLQDGAARVLNIPALDKLLRNIESPVFRNICRVMYIRGDSNAKRGRKSTENALRFLKKEGPDKVWRAVSYMFNDPGMKDVVDNQRWTNIKALSSIGDDDNKTTKCRF